VTACEWHAPPVHVCATWALCRCDTNCTPLSLPQVHPTAFIDPKAPADGTKFLAAEALRGKGALLLTHEGRRFCNELGRRDYVTKMITEKCAKSEEAGGAHVAWMLMDETSVIEFGRPAFMFYAKVKSFFTVCAHIFPPC
jgi:aspartate oxidase